MEPEVAPLIKDVVFSSVPTSADYVFFMPHYFVGDQIRISTYSVDDESWSTFTFPDEENYVVEDVVYIDDQTGVFTILARREGIALILQFRCTRVKAADYFSQSQAILV